MLGLRLFCVSLLVLSLCVYPLTHAAYIDCSMECLFAAFRPSHICDCKNNRKLHWGKRAPRARSHSLPTFRYGKRDSPLARFDEDDDTNRLDTLRLIRDVLAKDVE